MAREGLIEDLGRLAKSLESVVADPAAAWKVTRLADTISLLQRGPYDKGLQRRLIHDLVYVLDDVEVQAALGMANPVDDPEGGRERLVEQTDAATERFCQLAGAWRENRGPTSSLTEMAMRSEYQQIIGMGWNAVPLLLEELQRAPDHWFWALVAITGQDPVPPEHKGRLAEMTGVWLQWGRDHGYLVK